MIEQEELRVFISHGKNTDDVDQVKTTLEIAGIKVEIAVEEESTAISVPDKVFGAMRRSNAGIICASAEEGTGPESYVVNQDVLIEIDAAFVLYDTLVLLLWDKRVPVPSDRQNIYRCDYEGIELS
ncbi:MULTISPECIES: TIR domain-containing protein [unclassified Microbacterium]|uniref:TIR domain-containing protein n=1 Tax=unclassified Microbacterium TaxID=2609290 RepID=UPI00301651C5